MFTLPSTPDTTEAPEYTDLSDHFTLEELKSLPVTWHRSKSTTVTTQERDAAGKPWRRSGSLWIRLDPHTGERGFVGYLYQGATVSDRAATIQFLSMVQSGRTGHVWKKVEADWADDLTFYLAFPWLQCYDTATGPLIDCPITWCEEPWHDPDDVAHILRSLYRPLEQPSRGAYELDILVDMETGAPRIDFQAMHFEGTVADIDQLLLDLQTARADIIEFGTQEPQS